MTTRRDRAALARAVRWAERYQRGKPIILVPSPMPRVGSPEWIKRARRCAGVAQMITLRLRPWEAPPIVTDDEVTKPDRYGSRPQEVELRQRMIKLGVSVYEPDPIAAIEAAEAERAACSPIERGSRWPKHKGPQRAYARRSD